MWSKRESFEQTARFQSRLDCRASSDHDILPAPQAGYGHNDSHADGVPVV